MEFDHHARIAQLEEQVRLLGAALGLRIEDPGSVVPDEVLALVRDGKQVEAVRVLRKTTGLGLVEAKHLVDAADV